MKNESILINEMFISIQGESSWAGFPFFFIRTTGCNLRCRYCDTKYAYYKGEKFLISNVIENCKKSGIKKVLITGGEPLIQENIYNLMDGLIKNQFDVYLETNGSILLDRVNRKVIKIIDFKTPSSGELEKNNFDNLNFINKKDEIKFVISNYEDFKWSVEIIERFKLYNKVKNLLFSPAWGKLSNTTLINWIINNKLNYARFQLQLHKVLKVK